MSDQPKTIDEIIDEGLSTLPKDDNGAIDQKLLQDYVAERMSFDAEQAKRTKARQAIEKRRKPGSTLPVGQICFPGMEGFDYEPNRLVMGPDNEIIDNRRAKPKHKSAEARRTMDHAKHAMQQAVWRQQESSQYNDWTIEEMKKGRKFEKIMFETFIDETGIWKSSLSDDQT